MTEQDLIPGGADETVSVYDRGLAYGDGLFETILVENRTVYAWPEHFARLSAGLLQLGLPAVTSAELLRRVDVAVTSQSGCEQAWVVKIIITAGYSQRGYRRDPDSPLTIHVRANPLPKLRPLAVFLGTAPQTISSMPYLAGLKTLNRLDQVLAANPARQDVDDQLLTDHHSRVVCASSSNFFWREGGQWFTPPIIEGGIEGTRRALWITRLGARRQHASQGRLALAEQAFLCNAMNVYRPVARLQGRALAAQPPPKPEMLVGVNGGYQFHETAASFNGLYAGADNHQHHNCWSEIRGINR